MYTRNENRGEYEMMGQMYNYIQKGVDYMPGLFSVSLLRNAGGCGMGPSKSFTTVLQDAEIRGNARPRLTLPHCG